MWKKYGFIDAFNPLSGWYDADVLGIDLGITMLMAENHRSGFVWNTFMKNPEAQSAMQKAGFHAPQIAISKLVNNDIPTPPGVLCKEFGIA